MIFRSWNFFFLVILIIKKCKNHFELAVYKKVVGLICHGLSTPGYRAQKLDSVFVLGFLLIYGVDESSTKE